MNQNSEAKWEDVFSAELTELARGESSGDANPELKGRLTGLALSGGGVRSASFALGVMQALIEFKVHDRFHYLSMCSGGGYLGAAVLWLRNRYHENWTNQLTNVSGTRHDTPSLLGQPDTTVRTPVRKPGAEEPHVWLDYIRQHSNYLMPPRIGWGSLASVVIRNVTLSSGLYILLLAFALYSLDLHFEFLSPDPQCDLVALGAVCTDATSVAYAIAAVMLASFVMYSLSSYFLGMKGPAQILCALAFLLVPATFVYAGSITTLMAEGRVTTPQIRFAMMAAGLSAIVPLASIGYRQVVWIAELISGGAMSTDRDKGIYFLRWGMQIVGGAMVAILAALILIASAPALIAGAKRWAVPLLLSGIGVTVLIAASLRRKPLGGGSNTLRSLMTAIAFLVILLSGVLLSYVVAIHLHEFAPEVTLAALLLLLTAMFFTDLNQFGVGRMYRDRLMEAFMPNKNSIEIMRWRRATEAHASDGDLNTIWPPRMGPWSLYPLINTNVVLTDSAQDLYRGRGGDSFTLSPLFCGSFATGWTPTQKFADGKLKLGTAVAISGAAVHPHTSPGGQGLTRSRLASFVMFACQVRLGSWVMNPNPDLHKGFTSIRTWLLNQRPNFVFPGIISGLFGRGLTEDAHFLELSDGGHFDNTGVYELIRRKAKLIVLVQASQDKTFIFSDLANLAQKIRVDFGARLVFSDGLSLTKVVPKLADGYLTRLAARGHAIAKIHYAAEKAGERPQGWLVYLQATPISDIPVDVHSYYRSNESFPNEPTANQFFREAQFEAYRELGHAVAKRFLVDVGCSHAKDCYCDTSDEHHDRNDACFAEINEILLPTVPRSVAKKRDRRELSTDTEPAAVDGGKS